jgi:predicted permease
MVSGNYFGLLGVQPALGRLLTEDDDRAPGAHFVTVLGYRYWQTHLGANPGVLNQTLLVNGYPLTIVGVAQKGFRNERFGFAPEVYVPITMKARMTPDWDGLSERQDYWVSLVGRMKPGVTLAMAQTAINVAYQAMLRDEVKLIQGWSQTMRERFLAKRIVLKPGEYGRGGMRDGMQTPLYLMIAMTGVVLLIACANIANLLLARAATRAREIAVRLAVGAGHGRIVRLLLAEAAVIAAVGGALALLVARWTLDGILTAVENVPLPVSADISVRLLAYCSALTIATVFVFGLAPALRASRLDVAGMLKDQALQASASGRANRLRRSLVVAQAGLSLLLRVVSGLFAKSLVNVTRIKLGIDIGKMITFSVDPSLNRYDRSRTAELYNQLEQRVENIPGVASATVSSVALLTGDNWGANVAVRRKSPW